MLVNIAVFLYASQNLDYFVDKYGFSSDSFIRGNYINIITAMFMHKSILHIALNMTLLFFIAKQVENEIGWLVLPIYFLSGLIANIGVLLLPFIGQSATVVGASAAISGLIGYGAFKLSGDWVKSPLSFIPLPLPFIASGAMYFVINFAGVLAFDLPSIGHLVGGFAGAFIGMYGEDEKLKKMLIFIFLIGFITILPFLLENLLHSLNF